MTKECQIISIEDSAIKIEHTSCPSEGLTSLHIT